ncbi:hypothetical protein EC991_008566 [Linnemannia zychae]|nr:hypothetical protein EC991_008566 [Linnemannia zychae]
MLLIPTPHNTPIHIFDIPLILDLICDHLTKDDLLPCLQVSHYWHDLFKPQFLRCVRFADLKEHQTWAILDNAARIRSLTIDIADAGWLLDNPYSPCINLQVLRCVDFGYVYPHDYNSYDDELDHDSDSTSLESNQVDLSTSALNLIQSNPKLAVLEVIHCRQRYRTSHFTPAILTSISKHQTLSQIKINLDFLLPDSFLVALLHHLPLSLEDLSFSAVGALKQSGIPADSPKPTLQGPTNLRRISLRPCDTWFGEAEEGDHDESYIQRVVLLLIQNSPGLVDLSLAGYSGQVLILLQTLADVCPLVETIDFDGYNCVNHEIMALTGFLSHLREFKFYGYYSAVNREQRALVPTFLRRSSATLQVISRSGLPTILYLMIALDTGTIRRVKASLNTNKAFSS